MKTLILATAGLALAMSIGAKPAVADGDYGYYVHAAPTTVHYYGGRTHLELLSAELKVAANRICWDMYDNYRHNPGFAAAYRDAYKMAQDAEHIHSLVWEQQYESHRPFAEVDHIAKDLAEIDLLFHRIQTGVSRWKPYNHNPYHGIGMLPEKLEGFETSLHHLMEDYGVKTAVGGTPPAPALTAPPSPLPAATFAVPPQAVPPQLQEPQLVQ